MVVWLTNNKKTTVYWTSIIIYGKTFDRTIAQLKRNPRKKFQQSFRTYFFKKGEKRKKNKEKRKRKKEEEREVEKSDENILAKV